MILLNSKPRVKSQGMSEAWRVSRLMHWFGVCVVLHYGNMAKSCWDLWWILYLLFCWKNVIWPIINNENLHIFVVKHPPSFGVTISDVHRWWQWSWHKNDLMAITELKWTIKYLYYNKTPHVIRNSFKLLDLKTIFVIDNGISCSLCSTLAKRFNSISNFEKAKTRNL